MHRRAAGSSIEMEGIEMRLSALSIPLLIALALPAYPQAPVALPMATSVEPGEGHVGDLLVIQGVNLDRANVAALFLTDGTIDIKVAIVAQSVTSITFTLSTRFCRGGCDAMPDSLDDRIRHDNEVEIPPYA